MEKLFFSEPDVISNKRPGRRQPRIGKVTYYFVLFPEPEELIRLLRFP